MDPFLGLDREAPHDEGLVAVGTYFDNASLEVALSLLREAGIPFLAKDRGVGGAVRILAGYNMYGTDVFVREEDEETALELLTPADGEACDEESGDTGNGDTDKDDEDRI